MGESEGVERSREPPQTERDLDAFTQVLSIFSRINREERERLLRTLATYFDLGALPNQPVASHQGVPSQTSFSADRSPSPKAFLLEKKPSTDIERVACLAYYLTHFRDTPHFKTLDLSKLNTEAAQIKFSNAAKAVDNAAARGLLVQASKGQKQLSAIGELYVQALPDRQAARTAFSEARPRRPKPKRKDEKDAEEVDQDSI